MAIVFKGRDLGGSKWRCVEYLADSVLFVEKLSSQSDIDVDSIERAICSYDSPFCGGYAEVYISEVDSSGCYIAVVGSAVAAVVAIHQAVCKYARVCSAHWIGKAAAIVLADEAHPYEVRLDVELDHDLERIAKAFERDRDVKLCNVKRKLTSDLRSSLDSVVSFLNGYFNESGIDVNRIAVHKGSLWCSISSLGTKPSTYNDGCLSYIFTKAQETMKRFRRNDWESGRCVFLPKVHPAMEL